MTATRRTASGSRPVGPFTTFSSHPDRGAALAEAHARPTLAVSAPSVIDVLVFVPNESADTGAGGGTLLADLLPGPVEPDARYALHEGDGFRLKWERHTEFVTVTAAWSDTAPDGAFEARVAALAEGRASLLCALRVFVSPDPDSSLNPAGADRSAFAGRFKDGIVASSSFRPEPDGFIVVRVKVHDMDPDQLGRRVQRLIEVEMYRTAALLALPVAREEGQRLVRMEHDVLEATEALTAGDLKAEDALDRLRPIAAELEAMRSRTRYRFGASHAYASLVEERLDALAEEKIGSRPTISGFARTRLAPAMRTIRSVEDRQRDLSHALTRSLDILRTRIDLDLANANQDILASMDERQRRQLILSETVEGLSVIAISYYLLGLLSYPIKAWHASGTAPLAVGTLLALAVPVVVFSVFLAVRSIRRRARHRPRGDKG